MVDILQMSRSKEDWINNYSYFSTKIMILECHIMFMTSCIELGLTPKGLRPKIPVSGIPPQIRKCVNEFALKTSFELTCLILNEYKILKKRHEENILHLYSELPPEEIILESVNKINCENETLKSKRQINLNKKLSKLCKEATDSGLTLPTKYSYSFISESSNNNNCTTQTSNQFQDTASICNQTATDKNNLINLSSYNLTNDEISILNKGLTFSPQPKFDHINFVTNGLSFARKVRLAFYHSQNTSQNSNYNVPYFLNKFKPKSNFDPIPLPADHPIEQFINTIISNISDPKFSDTLKPKDNLTKNERNAITTLKKNSSIIILPADKGNSTVILNKEDYINEALKQLDDNEFYKKISENPTEKFNSEICEFLSRFGPEENLDISTITLLTPEHPRTPVFYLLPKVHKPERPPPGRPIVSGYGSPTERISALVDNTLQPLVKSLPSYIRDSKDFLDKINMINQPLRPNIFLVSIDVNSLYTNIPHEFGKESVKRFLQTRPPNTKPSTNFIIHLIDFILKMNNFSFNNQNYIQIKGTAMGTRMAPSFANLYMGDLEKDFINSQNLKPLCWFRFIDDIFMIWEHGLESLNCFLENLNKFSILKFTWNFSKDIITYLDLDVFVLDGIIKTKIHIKDTNTMDYLSYSSCHPIHIKKSIPKSLAIRAKDLCSENSDYLNYLNKLSNSLIKRGYPSKLVDRQTLAPKNNHNTNTHFSSDPKFITPYFPGLHKTNNILKIAYNILQSNPVTQHLFSKPPKLIFQKSPNLKNILSRPKLSNNTPTPFGCYPCNKTRCATCKSIVPSTIFTSSHTKRKYKIQNNISCESSNVIYQLTCKNCPKDYIGKTTNTLRIRMNGHRRDVTQKHIEKPVAIHAREHNQNFEQCFSLKGICKLPENSTDREVRQLEQAHQLVLKSKIPFGLNLR